MKKKNVNKEDDWAELKRRVSQDGIILDDDYIKYQKLTELLVEDEDDLVNTHMGIIKDDAKLLTEEGELITNVKGVGKEEDFQMDEYVNGLEKVVKHKLEIYSDLMKKIDRYKQHVQEEDNLRQRLDPKYFTDED